MKMIDLNFHLLLKKTFVFEVIAFYVQKVTENGYQIVRRNVLGPDVMNKFQFIMTRRSFKN